LEKSLFSGKFLFMRPKTIPTLILVMTVLLPAAAVTWAADQQNGSEAAAAGLTLTEAVMCERIEAYAPQTPAVVFSIDIGKVSCYSNFDPVPEKTYIYHRWYFKDRLTHRKKLFLKPPRWATYTSIQLREADRGPWRVEITDKDGHILKTLRFSITD
jgi:hypothetical protein